MTSQVDNSKKEMTSRMLLVGVLTFLSRVIGFFRDAVFAHFWGTGLAMAAWVWAFKIPNLFRALFGEGALTAAFIPLFSRKYETEGQQTSWLFACNILSVTAICLTLFTSLLVLISLVCRLFFSGPLVLVVLKLLPWVLPFIVLICLTALLSGVLNSLHHFLAPALMPVLLNVFLITSALFICPMCGETGEERIFGLAFGVLFAGVAQVAVLLLVLRKKGFRFQFRPKVTAAVHEVKRLALPALFGAGLFQINVFVDAILAGWLGAYAVTSLHFSQRLVYLPVGLFAVALSSVCLPMMSRAAAANRIGELISSLQFSLKMVLFLTLPVTLLFALFGDHIITLAFQRGEFDAQSTADTLYALCFYLPGIPAFAAIKVVVPAYHSRLDTKTPLKISLFCMLMNFVLNLVFMQCFDQGGLALATSISGILNFSLLLYFLRRDVGSLQLRGSFMDIGRLVVCLIPMAGVAMLCNYYVITAKLNGWTLFTELLVATVLSGIAYLLAAVWLKCEQPNVFWKKVWRK